MNKCDLFQKNPSLLVSPYQLQSPVSLSTFRLFISTLSGTPITITDANFPELLQLSEEFGFTEIASKLSEFRPSPPPKQTDTRRRIATLEEKAEQHDRLLAVFQDEVTQLSTDFERLAMEISALRSISIGIPTFSEEIPPQITKKLSDPVIKQISTEFKEVSAPNRSMTTRPSSQKLKALSFDSRIISDFPEIFAEFRSKHFNLLWRGSRDGFSAARFHGYCDRHGNTLTVILDTKGNVFGGFTPLKWESRMKMPWNKADGSLRSFVFTLKNPNNVGAKRFALKPEKKQFAICCDAALGPQFYDVGVSDHCNGNMKNVSYLGGSYTNETGVNGDRFFTGARNFQVKEIEVFEIAD
jgi:hypothetical protein